MSPGYFFCPKHVKGTGVREAFGKKYVNKRKSLKVTNNTEKIGEQFQNLRILMDHKHDGR